MLKLEKFIYHRDCLKNTFDKTFENMTSVTEKLKKLEKELSHNHSHNNLRDEEEKHNLSDDAVELERKFFLDFSNTSKKKSRDFGGYNLFY